MLFTQHIMSPIPMLLWCPACGARHIDLGEFAEKSHHTHACQNCGMVWRPAIVHTVGVEFLPGFLNETFIEPNKTKFCGPKVLHNDGKEFMCMGCGKTAKRTRNDPYPKIKHRKNKKNV